MTATETSEPSGSPAGGPRQAATEIAREVVTGWRPLVGSVVGLAGGLTSLEAYSRSVIFGFLELDYHWSVDTLANVALVIGLVQAFTNFVSGLLADRFKNRPLLLISGVVFGCCWFALTASASSLAWYVAMMCVMSLVTPGAMATVYSRVIGASFTRIRGLALGVMNTGPAIVAQFLPEILTHYAAHGGVTAMYRVLGFSAIALAVIAFVVLPRRLDRPGAIGGTGETAPQPGWEQLRPVVFTWSYLRVLVAFFFMGASTIGLITEFFTLLLQTGVTVDRAAYVLGFIGTAMFITRPTAGLLMDRLGGPLVTAGLFILGALGVIALAVGGRPMALLATLGLGIAIGSETDAMAFIVHKHFPLPMYGRLFGTGCMFFSLGTAAGPHMIAWFMGGKSPSPGLWAGAVLLLIPAAVMLTFVRRARE